MDKGSPIQSLKGIGEKKSLLFNKLGIFTIGELAQTDPAILTSHLKSHGTTLWEFANGIDDSGIVTEPQEAKGIGNSTTVAHDITDRAPASDVLFSLCESVSKRLHDAGFLAMQVTVEIKYSDFKSFSHQCATESPIETAAALHSISMSLFDKLWNGDPIRLLGVRAGKLVRPDEPYQLSLFAEGYLSHNTGDTGDAHLTDTTPLTVDSEKNKKLEAALRSIRDRYGKDSITKGKPGRG